jgi:hypothetical protein
MFLKPLLWITVETKFIVQIKLGTDFNISFATAPIDALVHPLCVFSDDDNGDKDTFCRFTLKKLEPLLWGKNKEK